MDSGRSVILRNDADLQGCGALSHAGGPRLALPYTVASNSSASSELRTTPHIGFTLLTKLN